jgi:hypothetical protein
MGRDYSTCSPKPMAHVVFRNLTATVSKTQYGGHGNGILTQGEPVDVTIDGVTWTGDYGAFFEYSPGSYMTEDGGKLTSGPIQSVAITGGGFNTGKYGSIKLKGYADGAQPVPPVVNALSVTGARITGANATMKKNFPTNTYV